MEAPPTGGDPVAADAECAAAGSPVPPPKSSSNPAIRSPRSTPSAAQPRCAPILSRIRAESPLAMRLPRRRCRG